MLSLKYMYLENLSLLGRAKTVELNMEQFFRECYRDESTCIIIVLFGLINNRLSKQIIRQVEAAVLRR